MRNCSIPPSKTTPTQAVLQRPPIKQLKRIKSVAAPRSKRSRQRRSGTNTLHFFDKECSTGISGHSLLRCNRTAAGNSFFKENFVPNNCSCFRFIVCFLLSISITRRLSCGQTIENTEGNIPSLTIKNLSLVVAQSRRAADLGEAAPARPSHSKSCLCRLKRPVYGLHSVSRCVLRQSFKVREIVF